MTKSRSKLTVTTLWANSVDEKLVIYSYNLHEMSNPVLVGKNKKNNVVS